MFKITNILFFLLVGTSLFAQTTCSAVIEKHPLEIGNWVSKSQMTNKLLKKSHKDALSKLPHNPNLEHATEDDIWKYFLSSKTSKNSNSHK